MLSKNVAEVNKEICVACGTCIKVCPRNAIEIFKGCYAEVKNQLCIGCGKCSKVCPAVCIRIKERNNI